MDIQLLEQKIWILVSAIGVLITLLGLLFGLSMWFAKSFVKRIIEQLDALIKEIQNLKLTDSNLFNDVKSVKQAQGKLESDFHDLKTKHESCKNYRKIP